MMIHMYSTLPYSSLTLCNVIYIVRYYSTVIICYVTRVEYICIYLGSSTSTALRGPE